MNANPINHIDPDENFIDLVNTADIFSCKYYNTSTFNESLPDHMRQCLSLLSFNIRSFKKNHDEFIGYLKNCNHEFDIIVLSETWAKEETHCMNSLPGYNAFHNYREDRRGGGVSIFVKDSLSFQPLDQFNISTDDFESAGVTVSIPSSAHAVVILGIYRRPGGDRN